MTKTNCQREFELWFQTTRLNYNLDYYLPGDYYNNRDVQWMYVGFKAGYEAARKGDEK